MHIRHGVEEAALLGEGRVRIGEDMVTMHICVLYQKKSSWLITFPAVETSHWKFSIGF